MSNENELLKHQLVYLQVCAGCSVLKTTLTIGGLRQSQVQRVQAALVLQAVWNERLEHISLVAERKP